MPKLAKRLGLCVICGSRVHSDESYLKAREGYCHRSCVVKFAVAA